ncbi:MAG: TldD/PmbA family protein [Candidatus Phytoplasma vitis]|nr:MAG: TldD/PmbA family protein [Candidatus Phytoplasma vitis]
MINNDNINYKKWFKTALSQNFEALEILTDRSKGITINLEDGKIHEHVQNDVLGTTIKGLFQNKKSSMYLEKIDETEMEDILGNLRNQISVLNIKEKDIIFEGSLSYPMVNNSNFDFSKIDIQKKYDLLFQLEKELLKSVLLKKIDTISYEETYLEKRIVNSKGLNLEDKLSFLTISVSCVFQKDKDIEEIYEYFVVKEFEKFDIKKYAKKIISLGESKLTSRSLKSKTYPVVFSNKIFANFLKNFSCIFNGMSAYRNLTKLKDKQGTNIASSKVTLIDDPLCKEALFQYKFDDEGVSCYTKKIIDKGVFKQFIHNLKTSLIFDVPPTGNSFSNSISMTNMYLEKGEQTFEEMITSINEGVYIDYIIGFHAGINDISGDFSLQAAGFKIEKGKITKPVKMIIVSGNFFDILLNLKGISNDLVFQFSGFGSPSVYAGDLTIAGEN